MPPRERLTQEQSEQIFFGWQDATINGVHFRPHADGTVSRACRRDSKAAREADIQLPHPTRRGWVIAIIDLARLMANPKIWTALAGAYLGLKMWLLIQPHLVYALMMPLVGVA